MNINLKVATSWNELNNWQLNKIANIIFFSSEKEKASFLLLFYLFINRPTVLNIFKLFYLFIQVPSSQLKKHTNFLYTSNNLTIFPKKLASLVGPKDRLANLKINEYAYADLFYYNFTQSKSDADLNRLVTVLYRPKAKSSKDIRTPFEIEKLKHHAKIVERLSKSKKMVVLMAFQGTRSLLYKRYRYVFKKGTKKTTYAPFTKIIASMARSKNQPFGNFYETQTANLYDFMDVLNDEIKDQKPN